MTRLAPLILSVLLSGLFQSVDAKSTKSQIRLYQFTSDECDGHPKGSNVDVKEGNSTCIDVDGRSFRPRLDEKRAKWLGELQEGKIECGLKLYNQPKCNNEDLEEMIALPGEIDMCYTSPTTKAIRSVQFVCQQIENDITTTFLTTRVGTAWSIGGEHSLTPHSTTETVVVTTVIPVSDFKQAARHRGERVTVKQNQQWLWMKHPWSGSAVCYECWTQDPNNFNWVKCHSRASEAAHCGPRLLAVTTTEMATTMTTSTESVTDPGTLIFTTTETLPAPLSDSLQSTTTTTLPAPLSDSAQSTTTTTLPAQLSASPQSLQPRSWHMKVSFGLPWNGNVVQMCADAEWEKRGTSNTEIRLQEVHQVDDKNKCDKAESLDLRPPEVETTTSTAILTATDTLTGYTASGTVTTTIYTAVNIVLVTTTLSSTVGTTTNSAIFPTVITSTAFTETEITITTVVPEEAPVTTFQRERDFERHPIPTHRDL